MATTHTPAQLEKSDHRDGAGQRKWTRRVFLFTLICMFALLAGFVSFLSQVDRYRLQPDSNISADGIVVLTGGFARLGPAVELLKNKRGERLLVSGVNRATSDNLLKNVLKVDDSLYDCCIDIDQDALDTIGNATGTADWAQSKGYRSMIVVTNDYHMPRSLLELDRKMGNVELIPYPVSNAHGDRESFGTKLDRYRVLTGEFGKYLAALLRGLNPSNRAPGTVAAGVSTGW